MYNLTFKQYLDSEVVVYYHNPINDEDDSDKRKVVPTTGEICPPNRRVEWCPFTDDFEIMYEIHDDDSSLRRSLRRTRQAIYDIAQSNEWDYFLTLTFDPQKVDSFDYAECTKKLSDWLKNNRRVCAKLKYIVVPEKHKSGRWHFHGLFANCEELGLVDSGKRTHDKRTIYNVGKYKLGFTTCIPIDNSPKICTYITKYITKESCECSKGKKRYWNTKNCCRPIEYKLLVEQGESVLDDLFLVDEYRKSVETLGGKVIYNTVPIYTTNTTRFKTSEDGQIYPPHINICESSEDNN